jgi:hypothetical protein
VEFSRAILDNSVLGVREQDNTASSKQGVIRLSALDVSSAVQGGSGLFSLEINCSSDVDMAMYLSQPGTGSLIEDYEMEEECESFVLKEGQSRPSRNGQPSDVARRAQLHQPSSNAAYHEPSWATPTPPRAGFGASWRWIFLSPSRYHLLLYAKARCGFPSSCQYRHL